MYQRCIMNSKLFHQSNLLIQVFCVPFHAMQCIRSPWFAFPWFSPLRPLILGLTPWQMSWSQLFPGYYGPSPAYYLILYMSFLNNYMPNAISFLSFLWVPNFQLDLVAWFNGDHCMSFLQVLISVRRPLIVQIPPVSFQMQFRVFVNSQISFAWLIARQGFGRFSWTCEPVILHLESRVNIRFCWHQPKCPSLYNCCWGLLYQVP